MNQQQPGSHVLFVSAKPAAPVSLPYGTECLFWCPTIRACFRRRATHRRFMRSPSGGWPAVMRALHCGDVCPIRLLGFGARAFEEGRIRHAAIRSLCCTEPVTRAGCGCGDRDLAASPGGWAKRPRGGPMLVLSDEGSKGARVELVKIGLIFCGQPAQRAGRSA